MYGDFNDGVKTGEERSFQVTVSTDTQQTKERRTRKNLGESETRVIR